MLKDKLPLLVIIGSLILMVANIITSETVDKGFLMRMISSVLLIFAMILTIKNKQKENNK